MENKLSITEQLTEKGIRPSFHRIRVLEYLYHHPTHPTVEEIYSDLSPEIPTLSKATIYNTLHSFVEAGLVREIGIDKEMLRYDIILESHGHFKCTACGEIFNFSIDLEKLPITDLQHFSIHQRDVYFSGLCPRCQSKTKPK